MEGQFIGRYELRGEIGRGAMARVWRAWDPNLERQVAIKEPLISDTLSDEVQQEIGRRFVKEAKAAAMLNHPNIVAVYEADIFDGRPAIVMELVEGATLGQVLDASGKLSPEAAGPILDDLLDGIGYAHSKGIVHRDLKPDNIFVTSEGRVKIGDFGIAHLQGASQTQATQMGTVLGTPGYMSPEQARGAAVDSRSDLFSVGVIAYEMLAGYNPFRLGDTDSTTVLYRIVHEDVPGLNAVGLAGLPESMAAAVSLALSKDPASRPATAEIMKTILHGGTASSKAFSDRTVISKQVKRTAISGWAPYVAVVAVCAVVLGGIFMAAGSSSGGGGGGSYAGTAANQTATQTAAKANVNSSGANVNTNTNANANANTNVSTSANTNTSTNTSTNTNTNTNANINTNTSVTKTKSYTYVTGTYTWSEAKAYCESHGGTLAVVQTQSDWDAIQSVLPRADTTKAWLGAFRDSSGTWKWVDDTTMQKAAWADGEPNNDGGDENYLITYFVNGDWYWYDVPNDISSYYRNQEIGFVMEIVG